MITRENYEIFFVDYLDGNLSADLQKEVKAFLISNPDLQLELNAINNFTVTQTSDNYDAKSELYKTDLDQADIFNQVAISIIEHDASPTQATEFEQYINTYPAKKADYERFKKVSKLPAPTISYPYKTKLYKRAIPLIWWQRAASIAAIFLLIISFSHFFSGNMSKQAETPLPVATNLNKLHKGQPATPLAPIEKSTAKDKVKIEQTATPKVQPKRPIKIETYPPLKKLTALRPVLTAQNANISIQPLTPTAMPTMAHRSHYSVRLTALKETIVDNGLAKAIQPEKIKKTFWKSLSVVTGERLIVFEDPTGKVRKISYDSDFLEVSIPLNN